MATATLTSKGQVTVPKEIRERLGLEKGDRIEFRVDRQGRVLVEPLAPSRPDPLAGLLHEYGRKPAPTVDEMNEAIGGYLTRKHVRKRRT
jgi:AbrB family looped-hinge helix DNA binding protein